MDQSIRPHSSPFQIFRRDTSSFVKRDLGGGATADLILEEVRARWDGLGPSERRRYEDLAVADRQRYEREMAALGITPDDDDDDDDDGDENENDGSYEEKDEHDEEEEEEEEEDDDDDDESAYGSGDSSSGNQQVPQNNAQNEEEDENEEEDDGGNEEEEEEFEVEEEEEEDNDDDDVEEERVSLGSEEESEEDFEDDDDSDEDYEAPGRRRTAKKTNKTKRKAVAKKKKTTTTTRKGRQPRTSPAKRSTGRGRSRAQTTTSARSKRSSTTRASQRSYPSRSRRSRSGGSSDIHSEDEDDEEEEELDLGDDDEDEEDENKQNTRRSYDTGPPEPQQPDQAGRRLGFLLRQSEIFKHFGAVGKQNDSARRTKEGGNDEEENDEGDDDNDSTEFLTAQPSTLGHGTMRVYQLEGLNWMIGLQAHNVNGILADEMGLGKTLQSISVLVYMAEYRNCYGPHLIVVPKSTLSNWMGELKRWGPTLKAVRFHGSKEEREVMVKTILYPKADEAHLRDWHVCVTTYELCGIEKNVLNKFKWNYLIIDEAHRLKNEASAFSKTVRTFSTKYRLLLTGTPLQNNLHELWALLNFLVPDVFASAEQFDEWFNLDIEDADAKNKLIEQLHKILRPFMLRRLKVDVETSLPAKHETILYTGMSALQKKVYKDILLRDLAVVQGGSGEGSSRTAVLNIVMQLRKCAGHPYLFPAVEDRTLNPLGEHLISNCGKMVLLDKLLHRMKERGHRVLLFTQMTRLLDIFEDYMVMRQFRYCRIDGNTTHEVREESIMNFNAPGSDKFVFLLSTRAGGLGINLQTADVVILYDSDWNPQADLQAQDRAHRIGQKKTVQVFRFVTEHTIEEKVVERAQQKLKLDAMVVQGGQFKKSNTDKKLSREELLDAVRFGADAIFKSKDSSITDDDIDMILSQGEQRTKLLNDKLLSKAEKGDLLDFKLDGCGSSMGVQTFEGIDYSQRQKFLSNQSKKNDLGVFGGAEALQLLDIGKRETRNQVTNYNEDQLYRQQVQIGGSGASRGGDKKRRFGATRLPKAYRLPRIEDFQMLDREALYAIQQEEEEAFQALLQEHEDDNTNNNDGTKTEGEDNINTNNDGGGSASGNASGNSKPKLDLDNLPPLLSEDRAAEKRELLAKGFLDWQKRHYSAFVKASAKHGRTAYDKIAEEVGMPSTRVEEYARAFWGGRGASFLGADHARALKSVERGESNLQKRNNLELATSKLLHLFDDPWRELEFTTCNPNNFGRDRTYTLEEDRFLLCWVHKYGYGQWNAIKMAIRRSPEFRFDYFLRCQPAEALGRRCEQLMRAAEKEIEGLEEQERNERRGKKNKGRDKNDSDDYTSEQSIELPRWKDKQLKLQDMARSEYEKEETRLMTEIEQLEDQIEQAQSRLRFLTDSDVIDDGLTWTDHALRDLINAIACSNSSSGVNQLATSMADRRILKKFGRKQIADKIEEVALRETDADGRRSWLIKDEYRYLLEVETLRYLRKGQTQGPSFPPSSPRKTMRQRSDSSILTASSSQPLNAELKKNNNNNELRDGAIGPGGTFLAFPPYEDPEEGPPKEPKKAFTHFCKANRRAVKKRLDDRERQDKQKVNAALKRQWQSLSDSQRVEWKEWEKWDVKRYAYHQAIYEEEGRKRKSVSSSEKDDRGQGRGRPSNGTLDSNSSIAEKNTEHKNNYHSNDDDTIIRKKRKYSESSSSRDHASMSRTKHYS